MPRPSSEEPEEPDDSAQWKSRYFQWTVDDEPGDVVDVSVAGGWDFIRDRFAPEGNAALDQIILIAKEHEVSVVFVERRYIDIDFRSEHTGFYGGTFRRYPSVCHRLHFFKGELDVTLNNLPNLIGSYKGYSVMRPTPTVYRS